MARKAICDWSKIDWSKTDTQIAKELNASLPTVGINRKKQTGKKTLKSIDWSQVDIFNDDVKSICQKLGITAEQVYTKRINESKKQGFRLREKINWCEVDLTQPVSKIAKLHNISKQAIYNRIERVKILSNDDWQKVDWTQDNTTLSKALLKHYDTVAHKRHELKVGKSDKISQRKDKGLPNPKRAYGAINQPKATEAAKNSPIAGRFETNIHAKDWVLIAPNNKVYHITNLQHFVRNNPHLFNAKDVEWKRSGGKHGAGGDYCNATAGLSNVRQGKSKAWKGWRLKT